MFFIASQDAMSSSNELPAPQRYSSPRSWRFLLNLSFKKKMQPQKGAEVCSKLQQSHQDSFLKHTYINTFYTNTLGISKNYQQQYCNEYTTFMCHTILHLLPYHLHKAFFCSQLKGLLVSLIAPHFSPPFLLPSRNK